jgi:hypothetical protein
MENNNEENKKILISGTSNRYQIKKLATKNDPVIVKKRKVVERWGLPIKYFEEDNQQDIVYDLITYMKREICPKYILDLSEEKYNIIQGVITTKINGYKHQDIIKKRLDEDRLVNLEEVLDIMKESNMCCHYCKQKVFLLYEVVREGSQWTLDRINNDIGHNTGNCVLCCLKCNLKRRKTSADAFLFTKQLNIVKKESEYETDVLK